MKKKYFILLIVFGLLILSGCKKTPDRAVPIELPLPSDSEPMPLGKPEVKTQVQVVASVLSEAEAKEVAERDCIKGGESVESGFYNSNSKTWWFDANLNATREGCNPACVVYENKTTEINWRCTGALPLNGQ